MKHASEVRAKQQKKTHTRNLCIFLILKCDTNTTQNLEVEIKKH